MLERNADIKTEFPHLKANFERSLRLVSDFVLRDLGELLDPRAWQVILCSVLEITSGGSRDAV